jgi:lincosamide nucleotidyltransferase A/C/D/E
MNAADVLKLYNDLRANGLAVWVDGGWCVDALLEKQTRPHPDLDIAVERKDAARIKELLTAWGYHEEIQSDTTAWNFAMKHGDKVVDVHVFEYDEAGNNFYGIKYPHGSLTGTGVIDGQQVDCVSPEWMFKFKTAYPPQEKDLKDVRALSNKFGFELPTSHQSL